MKSAFWLLILILLVTVWPWWLIRRARRVRQIVYEKEKQEAEQGNGEYRAPIIEAETVKAKDGLTYEKRFQLNETLVDAEKAAEAMPDIGKTLSGQR